MAKGIFYDEQSTTVLNEVVETTGDFPTFFTGSNDDDIIGLIRTFAFKFAPGGETAFGQTLSISGNEALFAIVGQTFGGNGVTNFQLPNLEHQVAIGPSTAAPEGTSAGASTAQVSAAEFPAALGGTAKPVTIAQPSLSVEYLIRTSGYFPSPGEMPAGGFIGEVLPFVGAAVPAGFALANGQLLSISSNTALYNIIGKTYGGNGTSNFALPNLTGRNIVGTSPTLTLGTIVGQSSVTLTKANLPETDGGSAATFNDQSPGLALNYIIAITGLFPEKGSDGDALSSEQYIGEVRAFAGPQSTIPQGWVLCDGQTLSIGENAALFSLLGTTYGGDGIRTFALPNLEDTTISSMDLSNDIGASYGANTSSLVVTDATPCFCRGTHVLTPRGEVAVETLCVGDEVITRRGEARPLRWIGHRRLAGTDLKQNSNAHPVRFRTGSLGAGQPHHDLLVSPEHAIFIDSVLIPARCLVNGSTIIVETDLLEVEYFHLELDTHDLLIAHGATCESFLDDDSRKLFDNADQYPSQSVSPIRRRTCAPKVTTGRYLDRIRRRLDRCAVQEVSLSWVGVHEITVAPGISALRLLTPCHQVPGDRRQLGAAIAHIAINGEILALSDKRLSSGWHECEPAWRWTDGAALLLVSDAQHVQVTVSALAVADAA